MDYFEKSWGENFRYWLQALLALNIIAVIACSQIEVTPFSTVIATSTATTNLAQFRFSPDFGALQRLSGSEWETIRRPIMDEDQEFPQRLNPESLFVEVHVEGQGWVSVQPEIRSPYAELLPECVAISLTFREADFTPGESSAFRDCVAEDSEFDLGLHLEVSYAGTESVADELIRNRIVPEDDLMPGELLYFPDPQWKPLGFSGVLAEAVNRDSDPTSQWGTYTLLGRASTVLFDIQIWIDDWWQGQTAEFPPISAHPQVQQARKAFEMIVLKWNQSGFSQRPLRLNVATNNIEELTGNKWRIFTPEPPRRGDPKWGVEVLIDEAWWPVLVSPPPAADWLPDYLEQLDLVEPIIPGQILITVEAYDQLQSVLKGR